MPEALWIALPFVAALGSGVLSFIVARGRMRVKLARRCKELDQERMELLLQVKAAREKAQTAELEAGRKVLDEVLSEIRLEERHFLREAGSGFERREHLVLQERICFRDTPLTHWIERELETGERLDPGLRFLPAVGKQERPLEIPPARKTRPRLR